MIALLIFCIFLACLGCGHLAIWLLGLGLCAFVVWLCGLFVYYFIREIFKR